MNENKNKNDESINAILEEKLSSRLHMFGLGEITAKRVIKFFGPTKTLSTIKENPYKLMLVPGISFKRADNIARSTGVKEDDPRRQQALVMHILEEATQAGHTFLPLATLDKKAKKEKVDIVQSSIIKDLVKEGLLVVEKSRPDEMPRVANIYLEKYHRAEKTVAEHLKVRQVREVQQKEEPPEVLRKLRSNLITEFTGSVWDEDQLKFLNNFYQRNVIVLTGGPGTGKTAVTKAVCAMLIVDGADFALCAPTGKAAKRCSELTGQPASTIHRLLKANPGLGSWKYDRYNKLPRSLKYVIVDESSMLDIVLVYRLLEAIPYETNIIFIGDVDQLQPVGPGSFFKDLIKSRIVPVYRLKTNHRQGKGSLIADNAIAINNGSLKFNYNNEDFFYIEAENAPVVREKLIHIIGVLREKLGYTDFTRDVQILTPQKKTTIGTEKLNELLRFRMNPKADPSEKFSPGDKVMQIRNDYHLGLFNGFIGQVISVEPNYYLIEFFDADSNKACQYPKGRKSNLIHAYACTVHKYQGSEVKVGIVVISSTHTWMLTRNLLYTGITRCKEICILVGDRMGLKKAIKNNSEQERHSRLLERLQV